MYVRTVVYYVVCHNCYVQIMLKIPQAALERAQRTTADTEAYQLCMTVIKARIFTIERLLKNEILVPVLMLKVETIYLQIRLLLEMFYLSSIVARKKKFDRYWPRTEKEYQPSEIRKFLGPPLDEHFPYPFRQSQDLSVPLNLEFFDRPITEPEVYKFFNKCHQYLHEPNPYKKNWFAREAECASLLEEAFEFLKKFWILLETHYRVSELDDGEKVGFVCKLGKEVDDVVVALLVSEGKESKQSTK
jgi:hypothetical protein